MLCNICLEDILTENEKLTTQCNHLFHKECLVQIIYPKCPCCKSNITNILNLNGITDKTIKRNIEAEEFRLLVTNQNLDLYGENDIYEICLNIKKLNHLKWRKIYKDIILSFIFNAYSVFQSFSEEMFKSNKNGIFLYYCDLDNIILNFIYGYKSSIIQWYEEKNFKDNPDFICFSKGVLNKIQNNYTDNFGVLFVINDIFDKKKFIFSQIFNKDNCIKKYPSNTNIIKSICELEPVKFDEEDRHNPEKIILETMLNYVKNKNVFNYSLKYDSFVNFIHNDIEDYFKIEDISTKNGFMHFKFFNSIDNSVGDIENDEDFYYFIENNKKKIKYNDLVNSSSLTIKNLNKILMKLLVKYSNGIVRLIIGSGDYTKICAYNIKYFDNECYFKKLEHVVIEQLFNVNLSEFEKYKRFIDFKNVYI